VPAAPPVLIVDDDDDVRETLQLVLEEEGYPVATAANGREALAQLDSGTPPERLPCLVLLDLLMPIMDGWETALAIAADPRLAALEVVICTSSPQQAPAGYPVLPKPISLSALLEVVRRSCAASGVPPSGGERSTRSRTR
jgi:CheY-like chemotaxis protein